MEIKLNVDITFTQDDIFMPSSLIGIDNLMNFVKAAIETYAAGHYRDKWNHDMSSSVEVELVDSKYNYNSD